jgi:hypothetical protein
MGAASHVANAQHGRICVIAVSLALTYCHFWCLALEVHLIPNFHLLHYPRWK